jgi:hypothetical protein
MAGEQVRAKGGIPAMWLQQEVQLLWSERTYGISVFQEESQERTQIVDGEEYKGGISLIKCRVVTLQSCEG